MSQSADIEWVVAAGIGSTGWAALGDPGSLDEARAPGDVVRIARNQHDTAGMVIALAQSDGVEVDVGWHDGVAVAARIEFVNDLLELSNDGEGTWEPIGDFECSTVAGLDLFDDSSLVDLPLSAGRYEAEGFFTTDGECLGVRISQVRDVRPAQASSESHSS